MRYALVFLPLFLFASLLSDLKQKELSYDKNFTLEDSKETKKSWINPIMIQYNYSKDNSLESIKTTNQLLSISISQPIFKSGAIYYSIKYANDLKDYNLKDLELKRRELIKNALDLAFDYKIAVLNKKISLLNIENTKIDVLRKKEAFLNGVGDSSLLNNAILSLNNLRLSLEDLNFQIESLKLNFKNISTMDISKVKLPRFKLISKNEFIENNLEFLKQQRLKKVKYDLYKMQIGNQLLSLNLNASYNWQDIEYSKTTPTLKSNSTNYYKIGFSVSMPISFNALNKIQKSKIDYLKSALLVEDKKNELLNLYKSTLFKIKTLDKKIKIYKENVKVYDDLIASTEDSIEVGNATNLDLKILENSKKMMVLNMEVLKLQKQKTLLEVYYKLINWNN
ncbi:MAG: TolC family protein [Nautiliaceae bacterium]